MGYVKGYTRGFRRPRRGLLFWLIVLALIGFASRAASGQELHPRFTKCSPAKDFHDWRVIYDGFQTRFNQRIMIGSYGPGNFPPVDEPVLPRGWAYISEDMYSGYPAEFSGLGIVEFMLPDVLSRDDIHYSWKICSKSSGLEQDWMRASGLRALFEHLGVTDYKRYTWTPSLGADSNLPVYEDDIEVQLRGSMAMGKISGQITVSRSRAPKGYDPSVPVWNDPIKYYRDSTGWIDF